MRSLESLALAAACAHAAAGFQAGMSGAGLRTARPLGAPRRGLELGGRRHRIRTASLRMQAQADDDTGLGGYNDPIYVHQLNERPCALGEVYAVRVLGAIALIDEDEVRGLLSISLSHRRG